MSEIRRGYAMLIQGGDAEISGALADGIMAIRLPMAKPLEPDQMAVVSKEIKRQKDYWKRTAERLRATMHKEPVDYASLVFDAEMRYGESVYEPGPGWRAAEKLLVGYAMVVMAFHDLFRWVGMEE